MLSLRGSYVFFMHNKPNCTENLNICPFMTFLSIKITSINQKERIQYFISAPMGAHLYAMNSQMASYSLILMFFYGIFILVVSAQPVHIKFCCDCSC